MIVHILVLLAGAVMIIFGANWVTDGATAVAKRFGVSDLVIGMTLVALGSSAPDLAVGIFSAAEGHTQFAIGNVVGSDIFDGWLVIGCVAMISPLCLSRRMMRLQLPMLLLAYGIIFVCANSTVFDGTDTNVITRGDGILMIIIFALITYISLRANNTHDQPDAKPQRVAMAHPWRVVAKILGGLALLVAGGDMFVNGAAGIATAAHISETVIGLTVVAFGTALPDLATSAVAAWRGHTAMAVGNAVGSCIMDALMVLGASACVAPLPMDGVGNVDLCVLAGGAAVLLAIGICSRKHTVPRWAGAIMGAGYVAYVVWTVIARA